MTSAPLDLDALEAAEAKVSPAPWKSHYDGAIYRAATRGESVVFADGNRDDAAFLVALRNAAPALIQAARERDQLLEQAALRTPTALENSMQEIMRINNEMLATVKERDAEIAKMREALEAAVQLAVGYEAWEADIVMNGDWRDGLPYLTQRQFDEMLELQAARNKTLAKARAARGREA